MGSNNNDNRAGMGRFDSFVRGFASVFDLCGRGIEVPDYTRGFERDGEALAGDWRRIGGDLRRAMDKVAAGE